MSYQCLGESNEYDAIYARSAALASSMPTTQLPDYSSMLRSNNYVAPTGPGAISRAVSGMGQGLLIFGILGGGLASALMIFYMLRPEMAEYA